MKHHAFRQTDRRACPWACLVICLAVMVGGCQSKEIPLSKAAQACKQGLLGEMNKLTPPLVVPVAKQDWPAVAAILEKSFENMEKEGRFIPVRLVVLDRDGITRGFFPQREGQLNFSNYEPTRMVFEEKKITQAVLYLAGAKIYILMAPILWQDQVTGAVVMGFPEKDLEKWKVPEKEFLSIDFNQ